MHPPTQKLLYLESVRGIAAFAVVISHLTFAFAYPDATGTPSGTAELSTDARTILQVAYWPIGAGRFAVAVFFVLSGIVLSQGYLRHRRTADLRTACVRRYFRLAVPSLVSVVAAFILWKSGLMFNRQAADLLAADGLPTEWLTCIDQPTPDLSVAVGQAVWDIFFGPPATAPGTLYNPVLWTMRIEFHGSLIVFGFLALFGSHPRASAFCVALTVMLAACGYVVLALFPVGVWIALVRHTQPDHRYPLGLSVGLILCSLALAGMYSYHVPRYVVIPIVHAIYESNDVAPAAAAVLLVSAVAFCPRLASWLEARPLVWLGKVSFGLYLSHLLIIASAGCGVYVAARTGMGLEHWPAAAVAAGVVAMLSLVAGWVMYYIADVPSVAIGKMVADRVLGPEPTDQAAVALKN